VNAPVDDVPARQPVKILVVEDSEDDARLVLLVLRRGGFHPIYRRVQDLAAFRAAFDNERWDAVLSDFRMPAFSGVDALHAFRALGIDIPFIFVSGTIGEEVAVEAMKAGASDYVMKQNLARLAPVLERELAQAAVRAERRQAQVEFELARQRAEQTIRESQWLLQAIVDNSAAVIYVKDLQGRYLLVNRCFGELLRLPQADILGKTDHQLFPAEVADAFRVADARAAGAASAVTAEEEAPWGDEVRTFLSVKCPLRDDGGRLTGVFGISTDITERKHAQARLQAQLERLQLLDQITTAIGERQDLQSIYQVAIGSLEAHLPADFACMCSHDIAAQALTVIRVGPRALALAPSLPMGDEARIAIRENGLAGCIEGDLVYEPDVRGAPFPFAQRLARHGLAALVAVPLVCENRVLGVLLVGRKQPDSFSSGECEFLRQLSAHVALAAQQAELRETLQLAYDDLRRTQEAVMQQERLRALGEMASGIAHDINNAISPVSLYAEHLLDSEKLSPHGRNALETMARAIDDVAAIVARMREFYRQREAPDELRPMRLNALVQQVVELTQARWRDMPQQRGVVVRLEMALAPELPEVRGIDSEIREALVNLVFNAVDAMPEGGTLTLRTRARGSGQDDDGAAVTRVAVEVEDTGMGMDEPTCRRCLEPFFTTKGERGTGLGLAMVYGIAQRHGAGVEIDSKPGRGTCVRLDFTVGSAPAQAPDPLARSALARPDEGLRILLIDDDPLIIRSLSDALAHDGHMVRTASGGRAGVEAFREAAGGGRGFQVVITDLGMPHMDGRRVAAAIKGLDPGVPVLLLTGWGRRMVADGDIPPHVDLVLSKPPKLQALRAALVHLVPGQGGRRAP
jgi:PAS domain S-box-containing protein